MNYLAKNLRTLRKTNHMNQAQLASRLNKYDTAISSWEREMSEPGIDDIQRLCEIFAVTVNELLFTDLSDVQAIKNQEPAKKEGNVQGNVQVSVQVKDKKEHSLTPELPSKDGQSNLKSQLEEYKELVKTLSTAVKAINASNEALVASNAQLVKDVEKLESLIRLIKHGIPEVGGGSVEGTQKAVG